MQRLLHEFIENIFATPAFPDRCQDYRAIAKHGVLAIAAAEVGDQIRFEVGELEMLSPIEWIPARRARPVTIDNCSGKKLLQVDDCQSFNAKLTTTQASRDQGKPADP
eukprot:SAG22_NODE_27_length_29018_cov_465.809646_30_plen_108_part_00